MKTKPNKKTTTEATHNGLAINTNEEKGLAIGTKAKGLVDHCNKQGKNGIIIDRNKADFEEKKNQCSHQASYLAKERGKENNPKGSWMVQGTRPPKKEK